MLHDVALHDFTGGHQAYIHKKKDLFMAHRILHLAKTTRSSRDARALSARRHYKLASRGQNPMYDFSILKVMTVCINAYAS